MSEGNSPKDGNTPLVPDGGAGGGFKNPLDPGGGKYHDKARDGTLESRTPAADLPKGPDPKPFSFGGK